MQPVTVIFHFLNIFDLVPIFVTNQTGLLIAINLQFHVYFQLYPLYNDPLPLFIAILKFLVVASDRIILLFRYFAVEYSEIIQRMRDEDALIHTRKFNCGHA